MATASTTTWVWFCSDQRIRLLIIVDGGVLKGLMRQPICVLEARLEVCTLLLLIAFLMADLLFLFPFAGFIAEVAVAFVKATSFAHAEKKMVPGHHGCVPQGIGSSHAFLLFIALLVSLLSVSRHVCGWLSGHSFGQGS
ncbi:hypothetical protein B296_00058644 [Ensete ventricosum]|uniref:Uncharacterized protein n=1 Tax=Ensete ventricosum TaxID=4639 RepID=A0A426XED3_ENSVE|nr:hypothetical protein B296_00058644 [Ensete ventricosum]